LLFWFLFDVGNSGKSSDFFFVEGVGSSKVFPIFLFILEAIGGSKLLSWEHFF
jgi:hypothetical protein